MSRARLSLPVFTLFIAVCLVVFAFVPAFSAGIQTGRVTGDYVVTHSGMTFDARGSSGDFVLSAVTTRTKGAAKGRYIIAINKPYDKSTNNVLGREKRGSLVLGLSRSGAGAELSVNLIVNDQSKNNLPIQGSTSFVLPLQFSSGTWADYAAGKDVTLGFTPAATANYTGGMGELMAKVFVSTLAGGIEGIDIATNVDSVTLTQSPVIRANLRQITVASMATRYVITLRSYVGSAPASAGR